MRYSSALVAMSLMAQTPAHARTISGVVVDVGGKPIGGARIDHGGDAPLAQVTDAKGHFHFETAAPAVVVRKIGFQSHFLRTEHAQQVRIVLEPVHAIVHAIAACTSVPKAETTSSQDIDYLSTTYIVKTKEDSASMICGRGAFWSGGVPRDSQVWESAEYFESVTGDRGKTKAGKYWAYRGTFGHSCSYSGEDQVAAAALDCLLNKPHEK